MRSMRLAVAGLSMALVLGSEARPAAAQTGTRWTGPWVNAHFTYAGGTSIDASLYFVDLSTTTSSSSGGGIAFGYSFNRWLSVYADLDVAPGQTITSATVTGTQTLYQGDAGVRGQLPVGESPLMLYVQLALSSRMLSGDAEIEGISPATGHAYNQWGSATTAGVGAQYLLGHALAADLNLLWSTGTYSTVRVTNIAPKASNASSSSSTRVLVGLTWYLDQ